MRHTRRHSRNRKSHRGGSSDVGSSDVPSNNVVDEHVEEVVNDSSSDLSQMGGRRSRGRRSSRVKRSRVSRKSRGTRKSGGRRSRRGGFVAGIGSALSEAFVPFTLLYGLNRSKRNRSKRGGDIA